ncbi:unnamed protein product [Cuscuta epithymum]|uniref:HORMA domain-containing protein n=1 Tax=Cuscuta epithymum TaxID=186058 RepID=A0AAV0D1X7_9ASTE|nr:unnamed protein product [Cuscuta epithymum]
MVVSQKVKETEITEQDSLLLTRNLLRIAIFNISYIRGLFPEKYFSDKSVPALEMKIKKLMPMDAESRRLLDWMEKGVYDALQKKYLRTLLFSVCEAIDGPMIEEYAFSFSYSSSDSQEVMMNVNRSGTKKRGTFKCNSDAEVTANQMRNSACKMVRTLVQLMRTLDQMPEERTILMKLLYYDDITPADYEPPFFRGYKEEEALNPWTKSPLKMDVGNVNSKHFVLALKVKSVLDPCEDDNDDNHSDNVSLAADSAQRDDSDIDSESSQSDDDQYVVAPREKGEKEQNAPLLDEGCSDDTQDPAEDEHQIGRVRDWINAHHLPKVELTDVFSSFPDISVALIEELMAKLVTEGVVSKTDTDTFTINKQNKSDYEFDAVKEEMDCQFGPKGNNAKKGSNQDYMYMKALYHALPMNYVSVSKLQSKLEGQASQPTVRKLIDKMTQDGFIEAKSNRKLGKRVIHSDLTEKKLSEVKKALEKDFMEVENHESVNNLKDLSTCGGLHSIGSDVTRTKGKSDAYQNESIRTDQTVSKRKDLGSTPTSRVEPVASRESFVPGHDENGRSNNKDSINNCDDSDNIICSRSSQGKRSRKASTVKEPILQSVKRLKSQAA